LTPEPVGNNALRCQLNEADQKRLRAQPSLAALGVQSAGEWKPQSQLVLTMNLQDLISGRDIRRERQIREARESPQRFMDVLAVLSSGDDEERLKKFLSAFDIDIDLPPRLLRRHPTANNSSGTDDGQFHVPAARSLRHFEVLHDAVIDFVKRHQDRLDRLVESGRAKGIPNFVHILLTVGNLLLSQIERIVAALEAETKLEMKPDRWNQIRDCLVAYYRALEHLFETAAVDYLDVLLEADKPAKISAEFAESLPELHNLLQRALRNRERLLELQQTRLVVKTSYGPVTGPGFFESILSPEKWSDFAKRLNGFDGQLKNRLSV
jgi:hypothetical protein